jgi:hypothetical protein
MAKRRDSSNSLSTPAQFDSFLPYGIYFGIPASYNCIFLRKLIGTGCSDDSEWKSLLFRIGAIPLLSVHLCLMYVQTRFIPLY